MASEPNLKWANSTSLNHKEEMRDGNNRTHNRQESNRSNS